MHSGAKTDISPDAYPSYKSIDDSQTPLPVRLRCWWCSKRACTACMSTTRTDELCPKSKTRYYILRYLGSKQCTITTYYQNATERNNRCSLLCTSIESSTECAGYGLVKSSASFICRLHLWRADQGSAGDDGDAPRFDEISHISENSPWPTLPAPFSRVCALCSVLTRSPCTACIFTRFQQNLGRRVPMHSHRVTPPHEPVRIKNVGFCDPSCLCAPPHLSITTTHLSPPCSVCIFTHKDGGPSQRNTRRRQGACRCQKCFGTEVLHAEILCARCFVRPCPVHGNERTQLEGQRHLAHLSVAEGHLKVGHRGVSRRYVAVRCMLRTLAVFLMHTLTSAFCCASALILHMQALINRQTSCKLSCRCIAAFQVELRCQII